MGHPVAICCASIDAFVRAHVWALASKRTAVLLAKADWRHLGDVMASLGRFDVISDTGSDPHLAPFNPMPIAVASDVAMPHPDHWPEQPAILFTSGSTGKPKAVAKRKLEILGEQECLAGVLPSADVPATYLATVPLEHMFGYTFGFWLPTLRGARIHGKRIVIPQDLRRACADSPGPVWIATTPIHIRAYTDLGIKFENVAGVICATAPLSHELARRGAESFGVPITEIYGSTETGAMAIRTRRSDEAEEPEWLSLPGMTVATDDAGVATCTAGHLAAPVTLGDHIEPGRGGFRIRGRVTDLVKVAGKRQSLAGLNALLSRVPGVRDGVYYFPSPHDAERPETIRPAVFVVMEPGYTAGHVVAGLRGKIDDVFVPRNVYQVDVLPRQETGKLRHTDLENLFRECRSRHAHPFR